MAELSPAEAEAQAAFEAYLEALSRTQRTMRFEDGMAAGKAWRRFLNVFLSEEQRKQLDAPNIVPLRRRA